MRRAIPILAVLALTGTATATPNLDRVPYVPEITAALDPGEHLSLPSATCDGLPPSNVHVYTRGGRPLHQYRIGPSQHTFRSRSGRTVTTYRHGLFRAYRGRVIVAAWCG